MTTFKNVINRYPVLTYFILTFIFTWGCMALAVYPGGFPITEEQFETAGALVYVAMLVGPSGAAVLLIGLLDGRSGFRELLSRLFRWKVNARWVVVALLTAPLVITGLLLGLSLVSSEFQPALFTADNKLAVVLSAVAVGLAVGFFEELGWTGFAVPRLMRHHGIFTTGLLVGIVWGAWHFLPFWESDTFSAVLPLALLLAQLFSWLPPYRILMVWVYGRTASLLLAVLMHASLVASLTTLVPAGLTGTALLTWILAWAAALWVIAAFVIIYNQESLSRQPAQSRLI